MNPFFQKGEKILFVGDSVTQCGRSDDGTDLGQGYPQKIAQIYDALFPESGVTFLNRAYYGDSTQQMLSRYQEAVKPECPDFISIMIGINDTWQRFYSGVAVSCEEMQKNLREYLCRLRSDFPLIKIMILEPVLLPSDPKKRCFREDLDPKIEVIRDLAAQYADFFLPADGLLHAQMLHTPAKELSADGVHLLAKGHAVLAYSWLKHLHII